MDKLVSELQTVTNKRNAKLLEKKIEDLNRELQNKCGRNKEKSFLFEVKLQNKQTKTNLKFQ